MKKHEKHTQLIKPELGIWGRNEFALVGAPCEIINKTASALAKLLEPRYKVAYIDADHNHEETNEEYSIRLQDKISHFALTKNNLSEYDRKILLNDADIILVNGNHFKAQKQIVFVHNKKETSLKKREDQLTDVIAYILIENSSIFNWLNIRDKPVFNLSQIESIAKTIENNCKIPPLNALILIGGKSMRMGENKSEIKYNEGLSQKDFLYKILNNSDSETYFSVSEPSGHNHEIIDQFRGLGPYGAILSAFRFNPNAAWLVLACDMPLIKDKEIKYLIENRNPSKIATACFNPETNFPDPLFTIWEPKSYQVLLSYLSLGYSCPRKVLINSDIHLIDLPNPEVLKNINSNEEKKAFLEIKK